MTRVLIGGIGYRNLRDHSFGVVLVDALAALEWPPGVCVEDISYNPIAVVQRLQDEPIDGGFELAVIVGALQRPGRMPGTLSVYRWDNVLPGAGRHPRGDHRGRDGDHLARQHAGRRPPLRGAARDGCGRRDRTRRARVRQLADARRRRSACRGEGGGHSAGSGTGHRGTSASGFVGRHSSPSHWCGLRTGD